LECPPECVLVTHSPPNGALDTSTTGENLGSESIRAAVIEKRPRLVVCGHIHGCSGRADRLGDSAVVNAGPRGMVWEL
jgi:Icc-related predicted phosphoesterase